MTTMLLHLQRVPARNGVLWIRHGFKVFKRSPVALFGLFGLFLLFVLLAMLVPVVGVLVFAMSLPVLSLGYMLATHLILQRKTPTASVFIAPFKLTPERARHQIILCASYALAALLTGLLADWLDGGSTREFQELLAKQADADAIATAAADPRLLWGMGFRGLLLLLLSVPYWFAPALIHWGGQGVGQALFSSTLALWRNKGAFALNSLLWGGLMLGSMSALSLLVALLGLAPVAPLLLMPLVVVLSVAFYASLYFGFVDCFMFGAPKDLLDDEA
jgi:hypothetical protein